MPSTGTVAYHERMPRQWQQPTPIAEIAASARQFRADKFVGLMRLVNQVGRNHKRRNQTIAIAGGPMRITKRSSGARSRRACGANGRLSKLPQTGRGRSCDSVNGQ